MTIHRFDRAVSSVAVARPRASRPAVARTPSQESLFAINGRFLTQRVTGVQRYGLEIVRALGRYADAKGRSITVAVPPQTTIPHDLPGVTGVHSGFYGGHLWEQSVLPWQSKPLLNLCNTAPVLGRRQIVCLHDANVFDVPESYASPFRLLYQALHPLIARRCSVVTTVSNHSARRLSKHLGLPEDQIVVAPNGHEHALRWKPERSRLSHASRPYIIVLGSLAQHKNVSRILSLAPELDQLGLDICVAGAPAATFAPTDIQKRPNVRFLGVVTDDDLAFLLQSALCLAFPSRCEGFGLPMLEAMVWGCPVVASNASCLPEVGGDACLYADPDDGRAWLAHFSALCRSPVRGNALRHAGATRAKTFSWTESARIYVDLLNRLLPGERNDR